MDVDDIKKILWTEAAEKKFGEFTPGGLTFEFITRQIYEDLQWMVFGIASTGCISPNKPKKMHQGRSGSDVCEHFFAKVRQNNSNPTLAQCQAITSKISGLSISSNHLSNFKNKSNTAGIKRHHSDYFEPVLYRHERRLNKIIVIA